MRYTRRRPTNLVVRLLVLATLLTGCGNPTQLASTQTPEIAATAPPTALPATATPAPTATSTPTPTLALPVRLQGDYPRPTDLLGASADQVVVELARWGDGSLNRLMLAPDGQTLAAATTAGFVLYDLPSLRQRAVQTAPASVAYAAFTPDSTRLVIAGKGFVQTHQATDGALLSTLTTDLEPVDGDVPVAFAPDGATWATLAADAVIIRKLSDGSVVREIPQPIDAPAHLSGLRYLPDGSLLVAGSGGSAAIRKLDPATGQVLFTAQSGALMRWAASDRYAAYAELGSAPRLVFLDLASGQTLGTEQLPDWVYELRFSPDGATLAAATSEDEICVWQLPGVARKGCLATPADYRSAPFAEGGGLLVPARDGQTLAVVDPATQATLQTFAREDEAGRLAFRKVLLSEHGRILVLNTSLQIELWDEATASLVATMPGFRSQLDYRTLTIVPQGQTALPVTSTHDLLLFGNLYQTAPMFDLVTGADVKPGGAFINQAALSADGATGAYLSGRDLTLVRGGQTRVLASMKAGTDFTNLALSPDGRLLAAAYRWNDENNVHIWDTERAAEIGVIAFTGAWYENRVAALSFSPDSRRLALVLEADERLQIYDLGNPSTPIKVLGAGTQKVGYVRSLAHTPDGASLVLGRQDGTILFLSTTDYATPGLTFDTGVNPMALGFLDGGRVLAIAGADGLAHLWGVNPQPTAIAAVPATATPAAATARPAVPSAGTAYPTPAALLSGAAGSLAPLARWGEGETRGLAVAADGRTAALATSIGVTLVALPDLEPLRRIATDYPVQRLALSPDGAFLVAELLGNGESFIGAWSVQTGELLYRTGSLPPQFETFGRATLPFDFTPDGRTLAVLADREIQFLDLATRSVAKRLALPLDMNATGLRFTQRGASLALVGAGLGTPAGLRWVDMGTYAFRPGILIPDDPLVAFAADGSLVAVLIEDGVSKTSQIQLLDAATGTTTSAHMSFAPSANAMAFSPDGTRLAALSANGDLCLWAVADGAELACLAKPVGSVLPQLAFTPDGGTVLAANPVQVLAWNTADLTPLSGLSESASQIRTFRVTAGDPAGDPARAVIQTISGLSLQSIGSEKALTHQADGEVLAVALAPDDAALFLAGAWGIAQVDIETHAVAWQVADGAVALELSPGGRSLAAARSDGRVALYALPGGAAPRVLEGLTQPATGLAWLQNGAVLIAWNAAEARLWNTKDGKALPAPTPMPTNLVAVLDGDTVGLKGNWAGINTTVTTGVWVSESGAQAGTNAGLQGRIAPLLAAVMRPDGLLLLGPTGLTMLNAAGRDAWTHALQPPPVPVIATSPNGDAIAVGDSKGVAILNTTGELLRTLPDATHVMALGNRGDTIALAHGDQVEVWQSTTRVVGGYSVMADGHYGLTFASDPQTLQAGLPNRPALIWTTGSGNTVLDARSGAPLGMAAESATRLAVSNDMRTVVEVTLNGALTLRRLGNPTVLLDGRDGYVTDVALSADGLHLAAVVTRGTSRSIEIWNATDGRLAATIAESGVMFDRVALDPEGRRLAASSGWNSDVRIYDLTQGARPGVLTTISQRGVTALAYSPDGAQLAVGDLRGRVTVLVAEAPTTVIATIDAHGSGIQALLYFPDNALLATAGDDGTVRLWGVVSQ